MRRSIGFGLTRDDRAEYIDKFPFAAPIGSLRDPEVSVRLRDAPISEVRGARRTVDSARRSRPFYFAAVRCGAVSAGDASIQEAVSSQPSDSMSLRSFAGPTTIGTVSMTL